MQDVQRLEQIQHFNRRGLRLYASDRDSPWHEPASEFLSGCTVRQELFCLAWPGPRRRAALDKPTQAVHNLNDLNVSAGS